jgi:cyclophilin family peptidyl-prolyl cis-trans isomerase
MNRLAHRRLLASESRRHQPIGTCRVPPPSSESCVFVRKLTLRLAATTSIAVTVVALLGLIGSVPAATGKTVAQKPSTNVLVPVSVAKGAGFTTVVDAPTVSTNTSITGCPEGAQEEFANASGQLGLVSEVLYCQSAGGATKLLQNFISTGKAQAGLKPPKALGSTAVERVGSGSNYLIVWQRGAAIELTGLSTDLPSNSTSTTTPTTVPLTPHEQQLLANAATQQNARFKEVVVSSGSGASAASSAANAKAQATANAASVAAGCPKNPATALTKTKWSSAPALTIVPTKTYTATVKTDVGSFVIALDAKDAPNTVNSFVFLAQHHFFDCVIFHRVIPGFVDQTGDPTGTGSGGPGYTIPDEYPAKASNPADQYPLGSVAMANSGQPHTGGSQWFVVAGSAGESLLPSYSLFGHVTSGLSVVKKINAQGSASGVPPDVTHRMLKVTISSS